MSSVLRLAIVDPNESSRERLKSTLLGLDTVWLEAECSRYEFFADVLNQTTPDVGFVAMDTDPDRALELVGELRDSAPNVSILVSCNSTDGNLILRAMRSGVQEFLPSPVDPEDLVAALQRVARNRFGGSERNSQGCRVVALAGATGGVGNTSLAVNMGCALAQNPANSVVLVDLDLALGDADVFLDTIPEYTISDVAQNVSRLDFTLLRRSLTKHSSGLYLLPRPVQLEDAQMISEEDVQRVIGLLKATFSHMIIDTSKSFSRLDMMAMDLADDVVLVTQLDLPCLRNVVRLMMSFKDSGTLKDKTKVIVNRVGRDSGQISLKKAQETIGSDIYWQVPNDYRVMVEVRNNGVPLIEQAPKAAISQSVASLAHTLFARDSDEIVVDGGDAAKGRKWLSFLPMGSKAEA